MNRAPLGTPLDVELEELDRFAKEVIPALPRRWLRGPRRRRAIDPRVGRQGWASVCGSRHPDGWLEGRLTGILALAILYSMSDLIPELARLSPRQRLDLIEALWESLEDKDVPVTEAQRAELDRRIAGLEQDGEQSISWDQLSAELRQRR
jgi:putative addiction module component (TIGR02574 family)